MPRKKLEKPVEPSEPTEEKPPSQAKAKDKAPAEAEKPKAARRKTAPKPVAEPEPKAVEPATPRRAAAKKTRPTAEPVAAAAVAKEKPARRSAKKDEFFDPEDRLLVTFRPYVKPVVPEKVEVPPAATARNRRRRGRGEEAPAAAPPPAPEIVMPTTPIESAETELPVLLWRPKGKVPAKREPVEEVHPVETGFEDAPAPRRSRRRGKQAEPVEEVPVPAEPVAAPAPPPVPRKAPIGVPETAPQIVMRSGVPTLVRDHRVYPPIMFFGNPADERKAAVVFEEVKMAADAGIHLHSFLIELVVDLESIDHSAGFAAYLMARTVEIDPQAQVLFRLEFRAPRGWEQQYPNAVYRDASGEIAEPSVCDDEFWSVAEECLQLFVRKIRLLESADHVLGVHLERGEWFFAEGHAFDDSRAATHQFREWARRRYINDEVTLRASWFDGGIRFDTIQVPDFQGEETSYDRFIRSSRKQRRYVDYHLFLSDATVHRISELAYAAKAASEGMILVGVSYGYTFEWSHPASGHLALGKLLRTEEVDYIAGPPSYRNRQPGGSAPFPCPIDSFALNGKLYISEEDFKTSLSSGHEPDDFNPALKTPQALESVHWRGAGVALAHGSGVQWMDLWGNGWLRTHSVFERAARVRDALIDRMEAPLGDPDVAVFIDERALAYLVDSKAFDLLVQNVRESVLRAGVSAAFYLLSDLAHREKFPESRLYLFLNAWDIRPELRAAIKSRLQRDDKVLFWLYSAGLFDAGRDSLERAREVTGIALKPQPFYSRTGTTILNRRHPLSEAFPDRTVMAGMKLEPSYFAIPEDGIVLGEYTQTGLPSFVVKEFHEDPNARWTSVFLGEPVVNPALIRALAQMAGAHVWNFHEDVVHVRGQFCTVHCSGTGPRTITLPNKSCAYNLLTADWAAIDSTNLRFVAIDGSTHVFLVGPKTEIEHFLNADPSKVLEIEHIPPRELNVRVDTANFDVPIMKLDEWIESGDQDEVADEWFLRPQQLLEEGQIEPAQAEETEQVGRRRRRRRRGRGGENGDRGMGSEEIVTARAEPSGTTEDEPFSMSVVFRKRE